MVYRAACRALAFAAVLAWAGAASAQTWTPEQQELWKLEEKQWQMAKDKDPSWIETMVHPNLSYWSIDSPVPQTKASLARESYKKERATVHGRYTDVFVKDGGRWLFLAWTGGDDPKK